MRKTLLIIGAGPKAIAIAAKAEALRRHGYTVPRIVILEAGDGPAHHWGGEGGYTCGTHQLGTPPEKDVGFPYQAAEWIGSEGLAISRYMLGTYSWHAYCVNQQNTMRESAPEARYSEWIDRGKPAPTHAVWCDYLRWVAGNLNWSDTGGGIETGTAVEEIGLTENGNQWRLTARRNGRSQIFEGEGLVITGPGEPKFGNNQVISQRIKGAIDNELVFDGASYWLPDSLAKFKAFDEMNLDTSVEAQVAEKTIAVIGGGETAASVVLDLLDRVPTLEKIFILTTEGHIFSRGESYYENMIYTDPGEHWASRPAQHRRNFIRRTDRSVFSQASLRVIDIDRRIQIVPCKVDRLEPAIDRKIVSIYGDVGGEYTEYPTNLAIAAMGFNALSFRSRMTDRRLRILAEMEEDSIESRITTDLSLSVRSMAGWQLSESLKLHLPLVAGFTQGPGFPNLSCLGTLADRILRPYVEKPTNE